VSDPILVPEPGRRAPGELPIAAKGQSFEIHEWRGSGPDYLHVHYADDEAWHVLEGTLTLRLGDRHVEALAGTTVFVPAGAPHAYWDATGAARYLIILTPRLSQLVAALHGAPRHGHGAILQQFQSSLLE
jgi:quercetin dioxygenase-like cupin family protein